MNCRRAAVLAWLLLAAGCYDPTALDGIACSASGQCPDGQSCDPDGVCRTPGDCVGLACRQATCLDGETTRLIGTVFAPTAVDPDPLPGVIVYVPNAPVEPFAPGVDCARCEAPSGSPLVQTVTGVDGRFVLENVPGGPDVPLVIQQGRWRRQITIPTVTACGDNEVPVALTRLPRSQAEGDIPRLALVTGSEDPLECALGKMIDPAEITSPSGTGRVHLYRENGNDLLVPLPGRADLLGNLTRLAEYDAVLLPCPSKEAYTGEEAQNLIAYADMGGRVYSTHGGGWWLFEPAEAYPGLADLDNQPDPESVTATVDTSFARGQVFAEWLVLTGASPTIGELPIAEPQRFVDRVRPPAQQWVYTESPRTVQHFTFDTPIDAADGEQCGRVLFSNFHAGSSLPDASLFPDSCQGGALTPEETLVEFMLFDVTGCIGR